MAIVLPERWVIANLKETQMTHIHPGLKVSIRVDAYPGLFSMAMLIAFSRGPDQDSAYAR